MKAGIKNEIFLIVLGLIFFIFSNNSFAQVAPCSTASGGLCEGYNSVQCSTVTLTDCAAFPRCMYSDAIDGYYCKKNCLNTAQQGSCSEGSVCLCLNQIECPLCTENGINLEVCSDGGCGAEDCVDPVVEITLPTSEATYATSVSPMELSGTASDETTLTQVTWSNNRNEGFVGGSGTADGTESWSIGYINLESGDNVITVTAADGWGNTGTDIITVTYTPPVTESFPIVSVNETSTDYSVSISDPDSLTEVAYAWGEKPNVYFLAPFANEDEAVLSETEQARWDYLYANFADDWDRLTGGKLPMKFYFVPPFQLADYSKNDDDWPAYITEAKEYFSTNHSDIQDYPAIYIYMYPEPYFEKTYVVRSGTESKQDVAEVYMSMFNDTAMTEYSSPNEIISNVLQHELAHYFAFLPNNGDVPPGTAKYFWMSHPAGFSGTQIACDDNSSQIDCDPYGIADSPTETEGYYEAYSILSLARTFIHKTNFGNLDPELSPLVEMEMGLRSRYEDENYIFHEGTVSGTGDNKQFTAGSSHDYNISSKRLYDYTIDQDNYHNLYWNISYDNTKTTLSNSTTEFDVSKSGQSGRSLIIYASDELNPGYFKIFTDNAYSQTFSENLPPAAPTGLTVN
jgi:hypothetical protein